MALDPVLNFAKVEVSTGYDDAATTVVLTAGEGAKLPDPSSAGAFNLVWWNSTDYPDPADDPNKEIVRCTARSTDTLTVARNQESSGASTKNTGGKTYKMAIALTKKMKDDIGAFQFFDAVVAASGGNYTTVGAAVTAGALSIYVKDGTYDGTVFHRVIDGFMVQGGGFDETGKQRDTRDEIKLESDNGLKNEEGTVAMARTSDPDSATNQFFINTADNIFLDHGYRDEGYAVFAKVVKGMDVVKKIEGVDTTTKHGMGDWPVNDVVIISAERV